MNKDLVIAIRSSTGVDQYTIAISPGSSITIRNDIGEANIPMDSFVATGGKNDLRNNEIGGVVEAGTTKGIIFWINKYNNKALVMSENDLKNKATWHDAMKICKEYDDTNWYLPTIYELDKIYESNLIKEGIYWSSAEDYENVEEGAFGQNFSNYSQSIYDKTGNFFGVRAVREIDLNKEVKNDAKSRCKIFR